MNQDLCIELIQLYGTFKCLWDPKDPEYVNKIKRQNCWKQISTQLKFPVLDLKKKMENLMGSYRREKSRERKSSIRRAVKGSKHVYISKWFGYKYFDFMATKNDPGPNEDATGNEAKTNPIENIKQEPEENTEQVSMENVTQNSEDPIKSIKQEPKENIKQESILKKLSSLHPKQTLKSRKIKSPPKQPPPKKRRIILGSTEKKPEPSADATFTQVFEILQRSIPNPTDSYYSFGMHIANELRKYDQQTLTFVKNAINHTIYEADMGAYTTALERTNPSYSHVHLPSNPSSSDAHYNLVYIKEEKNVD